MFELAKIHRIGTINMLLCILAQVVSDQAIDLILSQSFPLTKMLKSMLCKSKTFFFPFENDLEIN
jgi:hypothetical protein